MYGGCKSTFHLTGTHKTLDIVYSVAYNIGMFTVDRTSIFDKWLKKLRDRQARLIITTHIDRMTRGNLGNFKPVGEGVVEKKINYGAGYRLYYFQKGKSWIILLCGGDKGTQKADIAQAKQLKKELE